MRNILTSSILILATVAFPSLLSAQMGEGPNPAPADKIKKEQPAPPHDLSGTWAGRPPAADERNSVYGTDDGGWWNYALRGEDLSMTPWAQAKFKENKPSFGPNKEENSNDGAYACLPPGVPRVYAAIGTGMQIVDVPGRTLMFFGQNVRQIYADGRPHPKGVKPTWMGHSIGTWDGDTFIVDTVAINDSTWIDRMGHPHSDALHLVERFHRVSYNTLELEMTIDDPKAYTAPWNAHRAFQLRPPKNVRAGGGACEDVFLNEAFGLKPKLPSRQ